MQIGVAGLGRMGAAMAARLMEVGHTVTVWNRTPGKAKPLVDAGAKLAETPEDLAERSDTIITMLTDANAIDHVYNGEHGLLSGDVTDKLFIEMSTVRPLNDSTTLPCNGIKSFSFGTSKLSQL